MNWLIVKNFGKIKYFNISYVVLLLVPICANLIEVINKKTNSDYSLPLTIKALYAASILFAIAIAIYQYRCPTIIKDYKKIQDYIHDNRIFLENYAPYHKFYIVLAQLPLSEIDIRKELITEFIATKQSGITDEERMKMKSELDKKLTDYYSGSIQTKLRSTWNSESKKEPLSIWLSGIFYLLGTLIILILLITRTIIVATS